jgi:hypothetical protein
MWRVWRDGPGVRASLAATLVALLGCTHAAPAERENGGGPSEPSGAPAAGLPSGTGETGDAVLTVVWSDPSPRFAVACGADLFDQRQHWLRAAAAQGPLTERFMIRAGGGKVQCFVAETADFGAKWAIFEDDYSCGGRGSLRLDLHVEKLPDGQLAFDTTYAAKGCRTGSAGPTRRLVSRRRDLPRRICCGEHRDEFRPD